MLEKLEVGKVGRTRTDSDTRNFQQNSDRHSTLLTEKIMGAQSFNFDPKFPQN